MFKRFIAWFRTPLFVISSARKPVKRGPKKAACLHRQDRAGIIFRHHCGESTKGISKSTGWAQRTVQQVIREHKMGCCK